MIVVRDVFRVKFGKAKEATDLWKKAVAMLNKSGYGGGTTRILTDLAGPPYYTLVLETSYESVSKWEEAGKEVRKNAEWKSIYQQIVPLTEEGRREILAVVE